MERFKLATLVSTLIACSVSTAVMANPALSPEVKEYVDQQLAQFSGASLQSQDWDNLCSPGNIAHGCMPDCSGAKSIACNRVFAQAHAPQIDGIPSSIVKNGMYVKALTPSNSASEDGPSLLYISGNDNNLCTLHYTSGEFIPNRGTYSETGTPNFVTQLRNAEPRNPVRNYSHSSVGGTNRNFELFQDGTFPSGQTFYMICLGYGYVNNAMVSKPIGNFTVTW